MTKRKPKIVKLVESSQKEKEKNEAAVRKGLYDLRQQIMEFMNPMFKELAPLEEYYDGIKIDFGFHGPSEIVRDAPCIDISFSNTVICKVIATTGSKKGKKLFYQCSGRTDKYNSVDEFLKKIVPALVENGIFERRKNV
jgi:hypothetical protein